MKGFVYLVGAGPGDPELITFKGQKAIQKADVIVYDRLANPRLLKLARWDAEKIDAGNLTQEEVNQLLIQKAKEGKMVARLKEGDPFVFGHGGEEMEYLAEEGIGFEIVPGVPAATSVPAYAGIPVVHRDDSASFTVVSGHEWSKVRWDKLAAVTETLIFHMSAEDVPLVAEQLIAHGRLPETPIAVIFQGTTTNQYTLIGTLADIVEKVEKNNSASPTIVVVGEVVRLRDSLSWFEQKPLFGKRVLVTRARNQSGVLIEKIEELGGEAVEFPVIRIAPPKRLDLFDSALKRLHEFDWIIFTSVNGVACFFQRLKELRIDLRQMGKARIAAIGSKTAEVLEEKGLFVDALPKEYVAEALVEHLRPLVKANEKILLPRANIAREVLADELKELGCDVTVVDAYDTEIDAENAEEIVQYLKEGKIDIITFTSSSTVKNFLQATQSVEPDVLSLLKRVTIACIGPITANTARELGFHVDVVAKTYTIDGLVDAIRLKVVEEKSEPKLNHCR